MTNLSTLLPSSCGGMVASVASMVPQLDLHNNNGGMGESIRKARYK